MKKLSLLFLAALAAAPSLSARGVAPVGVDSILFSRHGDYMVVGMDLDLRPTDIPSGRAQVITPLIVSEAGDTVPLHSVGIYGRQRYINFLRNDRDELTKETQTTYKAAERPQHYAYSVSVPYEPWMNGSRLMVRRSLFGCADCLIDEKVNPITDYYELTPGIPEIIYFDALETGPVIESLDGAAYIDFVVDKTDINPTYRRNPQELRKIRATIDTVLNDNDVKITGVWLKGFASPESPYSHNRDLAIGRTEALKNHIGRLYNFSPSIISTDYEPEDWAGLRRFVADSDLSHRDEILAIIDSDMQPDPKEALIKKKYPEEYRYMLKEYYPALRHTEYKITYEVKRFDDVDKIREVMRTKPNRLTLREFFILGNATTPGSDEFNEVFETAVRMYPDDPIANINAANAALQRKDFVSAGKYLSKAGDSPEAIYARGSLAFSMGDYDKAAELMRQLPQMKAARDVLAEIDRINASKVEKASSLVLE